MKQIICVVMLATVALLGCSDANSQGGQFKNKCSKDAADFMSKSRTVIDEATGADRDRRLTDLRIEYANKMDPTAFIATQEAIDAWRMYNDTRYDRYLSQTVSALERAFAACKQYK